jgi:osmotically-inducible protein OsmY
MGTNLKQWLTMIGQGMASLCLVAALAGCQSTHGQTTGRYVDDSMITTAVKSKLVADRFGNLSRVDVETTNGTVHLNGIVENAEQKARAGQLAAQVDGVRHVDNDLQIQR